MHIGIKIALVPGQGFRADSFTEAQRRRALMVRWGFVLRRMFLKNNTCIQYYFPDFLLQTTMGTWLIFGGSALSVGEPVCVCSKRDLCALSICFFWEVMT